MSFASGARLGPYEVVSAIGAGGMGEVYKARDTKLNRDVALKVLPEAFALDADRLARFNREAQVLASLNHPNIAAIYGLEDADGIRALVLELVEGPTLADRITQGAIPLDEALPIARQVADALEAAHEHGVIHRDLKPSNIKVRADGTVKVLDFGLAKVLELTPASDLSQSPTITSPAMTGMGVILGTAAYMSPEQAKGKPVDKRADIWAFGCVLYEMLAGKRAFAGDNVTDALARVLMKEPEWHALPPSTPPAIRKLIRRCLAKDRRERLSDAADARLEIDETLTAPSGDAVATTTLVLPRAPLWRRAVAPTLTLILGGLIVGVAVWLITRPILSPLRVSRFTITPASAAALTISGADRDLAITPDGTRVAYVGPTATLFVQALDQLEPTALSGLGAPHGPFFSPDGQWIGFFDGASTLKKVAITGGPALTLCHLDSQARGAAWGPDGTIVFATFSGVLWRVSSGGGEPTMLTKRNPSQQSMWPEFLPGGHAVLFTRTLDTAPIDTAALMVLDLTTGTQKILMRGGSHAHYMPSGHLVYGAAGTVRAVAFNLDRLETIGGPVPVLPSVVTTAIGAADFDVGQDGTLAYVTGAGQGSEIRTLAWVDRRGREEPIKAPARRYFFARPSPDGTRIALDIRDQQNDIWIWDVPRETLTRLTVDPGIDRFPVWTPDGRRVIFSSTGTGVSNLFWQAADGTGPVERLTQSSNAQFPYSISPDGRQLVFREDAPTRDLMMLSLDSEHRVRPLLRSPFAEENGEISPDGRWLAYDSDESGQFEIYVRPFPEVNSGRWHVSTSGGSKPLWSRNGQELFYVPPAGGLMGVRVERGPTWKARTPTKVLEGQYLWSLPGLAGRPSDISPDGARFLLFKSVGEADQRTARASLVVVQNWFEELKRLVPTR